MTTTMYIYIKSIPDLVPKHRFFYKEEREVVGEFRSGEEEGLSFKVSARYEPARLDHEKLIINDLMTRQNRMGTRCTALILTSIKVEHNRKKLQSSDGTETGAGTLLTSCQHRFTHAFHLQGESNAICLHNVE